MSDITEKDLCRQVASNLTKESLFNAAKDKLCQKAAREARAIMAHHLQNCIAVWSAFEKFLHRQLCDKKRTVDTLVMGIFKPTATDTINYHPQPDFLELGKFKLRNQGIKEYREAYEMIKVRT